MTWNYTSFDPEGRAYYNFANVNSKSTIKKDKLQNEFKTDSIFIRDFPFGSMTETELDYLNSLIIEYKEITTPSWRRHQIWQALNYAPHPDQILPCLYPYFYDLSSPTTYTLAIQEGGDTNNTWGRKDIPDNIKNWYHTGVGIREQQGTNKWGDTEWGSGRENKSVYRFVYDLEYSPELSNVLASVPEYRQENPKNSGHPNVNKTSWKLNSFFLGFWGVSAESRYLEHTKTNYLIDSRTGIYETPLVYSYGDGHHHSPYKYLSNGQQTFTDDSILTATEAFNGKAYANRVAVPFFTLPWISSDVYSSFKGGPLDRFKGKNDFRADDAYQYASNVLKYNGIDHWYLYDSNGKGHFIAKPFQYKDGRIGSIGNLDSIIRAKTYGFSFRNYYETSVPQTSGVSSLPMRGDEITNIWKYESQITDQEIVFFIRLKYGFAHYEKFKNQDYYTESIRAKRERGNELSYPRTLLNPLGHGYYNNSDVVTKKQLASISMYAIPFWNDEPDKPGNLFKESYSDHKIGTTYDCKPTMVVTKESFISKQAEFAIELRDSEKLSHDGQRPTDNSIGGLSTEFGVSSFKPDYIELCNQIQNYNFQNLKINYRPGRPGGEDEQPGYKTSGWRMSYYPDLWMNQILLQKIVSSKKYSFNVNQVCRFSDIRAHWRASRILVEILKWSKYVATGLNDGSVLAVMGNSVNIDPCTSEIKNSASQQNQPSNLANSLFFISGNNTEESNSEFDLRPWMELFKYSNNPNDKQTFKSDRKVNSSVDCGTVTQYLRHNITPKLFLYFSDLLYDDEQMLQTKGAVRDRMGWYNMFDDLKFIKDSDVANKLTPNHKDNKGLSFDQIAKKYTDQIKKWSTFKDQIFIPTIAVITALEITTIVLHHSAISSRRHLSHTLHTVILVIEGILVGYKTVVNYRKGDYGKIVRDIAVFAAFSFLVPAAKEAVKKLVGKAGLPTWAEIAIALTGIGVGLTNFVLDTKAQLSEYESKSNKFIDLLNKATSEGYVEGPYAESLGAIRILKSKDGQLPIKTTYDEKTNSFSNEYQNFQTRSEFSGSVITSYQDLMLKINKKFVEPGGDGENKFFKQLTECECNLLKKATDFGGDQRYLRTFQNDGDVIGEDEYLKSPSKRSEALGDTLVNPPNGNATVPYIDYAPAIYDLGHFYPLKVSNDILPTWKDGPKWKYGTYDLNNMTPDDYKNSFIPWEAYKATPSRYGGKKSEWIRATRGYWYENFIGDVNNKPRKPSRWNPSELEGTTGFYEMAGPAFRYTRLNISRATSLCDTSPIFKLSSTNYGSSNGIVVSAGRTVKGDVIAVANPTEYGLDSWGGTGIDLQPNKTHVKFNPPFRMDFREAVWMIRKKYGLDKVRGGVGSYCCGVYSVPTLVDYAQQESTETSTNFVCIYEISFATPSFRQRLIANCDNRTSKNEQEEKTEEVRKDDPMIGRWDHNTEMAFQSELIETWVEEDDERKRKRKQKTRKVTTVTDCIQNLAQLPRLGIPVNIPGAPSYGWPLFQNCSGNTPTLLLNEIRNNKSDSFLQFVSLFLTVVRPQIIEYYSKFLGENPDGTHDLSLENGTYRQVSAKVALERYKGINTERGIRYYDVNGGRLGVAYLYRAPYYTIRSSRRRRVFI